MAIAQTTTISFSAIIIVLFSSSIAAHTSGNVGGRPKATDIMAEASKNASVNSDKYTRITEEFCVSTLRSDNRGDKAKDLRDLALIGIDILKGRAITTNGKVQEMLHSAKNGMSMSHRLTFCKLDYDVTISVMNVCTALLKDYRGPTGSDNDGQASFELPECAEQVNTLIGYCRHELIDMSGRERDALFHEYLELSKLAHLNIALLAPYRDDDS